MPDVVLVDHYKTLSAKKQGAENRTWFADTIHPNGLVSQKTRANWFPSFTSLVTRPERTQSWT